MRGSEGSGGPLLLGKRNFSSRPQDVAVACMVFSAGEGVRIWSYASVCADTTVQNLPVCNPFINCSVGLIRMIWLLTSPKLKKWFLVRPL